MNNDCPKTKACVSNKCRDPCPGVCGRNAECYVANHSPVCTCFCGYVGNPSVACHEMPKRMKNRTNFVPQSNNTQNFVYYFCSN